MENILKKGLANALAVAMCAVALLAGQAAVPQAAVADELPMSQVLVKSHKLSSVLPDVSATQKDEADSSMASTQELNTRDESEYDSVMDVYGSGNEIWGDYVCYKNLTFRGGGTLTIHGDLIVYGGLNNVDGCKIYVEGNVFILDDFAIKNSSSLTSKASILSYGNISVSGSGTSLSAYDQVAALGNVSVSSNAKVSVTRGNASTMGDSIDPEDAASLNAALTGSGALHADGNLSINRGKISVKASSARPAAIKSCGKLSITNSSSVSATFYGEKNWAIASSSDISLSGSTVSASGKNGIGSLGSISIYKGTTKATSGSSKGLAIYAWSNVKAKYAKITAKSSWRGIEADGCMSLYKCTTWASGKDAALFSHKKMTVKYGSVTVYNSSKSLKNKAAIWSNSTIESYKANYKVVAKKTRGIMARSGGTFKYCKGNIYAKKKYGIQGNKKVKVYKGSLKVNKKKVSGKQYRF